MTIEEKAKAYDEAIKKVKKDLQVCEQDCLVTKQIFRYFPELAMSKDEKIRKELIEHVKDQQSSFISAPDCRDKYEEEENNKYNSWLAWLEKQGGKKPAIEMKSAEESLGIDSETYNKIVDECIYGDDKQKSAWSEEDERILNQIIKDYERANESWLKCQGSLPFGNRIKWLKSLKDKYTWKPSIAQLNALSIVSKGNAPDDIEAIVSLYNDLKKLTE